MSTETQRAVEEALLAHLQDECGEEPWLLTDWLTVVAARSADLEQTNYLHLRSDAPFHIHLGLVEVIKASLNDSWDEREL